MLSCMHEEIAVAMAHGYAKIEGRPLPVLVQSTVGLQHASMALYNAYCDQVPIYMIAGNTVDVTVRGLSFESPHSAIDPAVIVRDFVKWDDQPASLQHFAESAVRAYKIAMTPPMAPVLLSVDSELQENPIPNRPATGQGGKSGDHCRSPGADTGGHGAPDRAGRAAAMCGGGHRQPFEFSQPPSALPHR